MTTALPRRRSLMLTFALTLLALVPLLYTACSEKVEGRQKAPECEITAPLDSIFAPMFPDNQPGALVMVMKDGEIVYDRGFGIANYETGENITDTTLFNIASVTKQFTAAAVATLHAQGRLSLGDSIAKYYPSWPSPVYKRITLEQMLSHTSGLPDARPRTAEEWQRYLAGHTSRYSRLPDYIHFSRLRETEQMLADVDSLKFEPGTAYDYQNPTYQVMLSVVEQANGGVPFEAWMQQRIFRPAGMESTRYFSANMPMEHAAHGYRHSTGATNVNTSPDGRWEEYDYGEANFFPTRADGGIYTNGRDFMRWQQALYGREVISDSVRTLLHTPRTTTDSLGIEYGLGFYIQNPDAGAPAKIFHTGDNGGFTIYECAFPAQNISYLIFATHPHWNRAATSAAVDSVLAANGWL